MILSSLKLQNFKRYKEFSLEFQTGLVGIIGKNGSGKSTIFEAIFFALYGELRTKGYKEIVRNSQATSKDVVLVQLEFEYENITYKIIREFRGKALSATAKLFKNEELIVSGAKEVTTAIIKLTKMSKDAFRHTLFASQKELTSLSTLKNEDRKKMIRKLLGLEKIDFIEKELVEKSRQIKRELEAFKEVLLDDEKIKEKKDSIKEYEKQNDTFSKELKEFSTSIDKLKLDEIDIKKQLDIFLETKEKKQKLLSSLELLKNTINSNENQSKKLQNELKLLEEKKQKLELLKDIKQEYENLTAQLKEQNSLKEYSLKKDALLKEQVLLRQQYKKAKQDIQELQNELSHYDSALQQQTKLVNDIETINKTLQTLQKNEQEILSNISAEKRIIQDTTQKIKGIENLGKESSCPTCTRPLLEEYDNVLSSLNNTIQYIQQNKIEKLNSEHAKLKQQITQTLQQKENLDKEYLKVSSDINLLQSKQKDLNSTQEYFNQIEQKGKSNNENIAKLESYIYDETTHKSIQTSYEKIVPKYEEYKSLVIIVKRVEPLSRELNQLKENISKQKQQYDYDEIEYKKVNYDEKSHLDTKQKYETIQKQKDEHTQKLLSIKESIATLKGKIETISSSLNENDKHLLKLQSKKDDLKDYEKIKISLSDFKTKLNSKVAPQISSEASSLYSTITKGKYQHIEVNNDFDFFIYDEGVKYPIERFSGGEVDLANLVLRIAISKTLASLSGSSGIGFLAFDEVFGSQDESRRMMILEAFHTIKEQYRQIFLISHELEIKESFESVEQL